MGGNDCKRAAGEFIATLWNSKSTCNLNSETNPLQISVCFIKTTSPKQKQLFTKHVFFSFLFFQLWFVVTYPEIIFQKTLKCPRLFRVEVLKFRTVSLQVIFGVSNWSLSNHSQQWKQLSVAVEQGKSHWIQVGLVYTVNMIVRLFSITHTPTHSQI